MRAATVKGDCYYYPWPVNIRNEVTFFKIHSPSIVYFHLNGSRKVFWGTVKGASDLTRTFNLTFRPEANWVEVKGDCLTRVHLNKRIRAGSE